MNPVFADGRGFTASAVLGFAFEPLIGLATALAFAEAPAFFVYASALGLCLPTPFGAALLGTPASSRVGEAA